MQSIFGIRAQHIVSPQLMLMECDLLAPRGQEGRKYSVKGPGEGLDGPQVSGYLMFPSLSCLRLPSGLQFRYLNSVQLSCWVVIRDSGLASLCPSPGGGGTELGSTCSRCCLLLF